MLCEPSVFLSFVIRLIAAHDCLGGAVQFTWTFWFDKRALAPGGRRLPGEQQLYETNLREIGSFATVEDFWRYYHHIVKPTEIEASVNDDRLSIDVAFLSFSVSSSKLTFFPLTDRLMQTVICLRAA